MNKDTEEKTNRKEKKKLFIMHTIPSISEIDRHRKKKTSIGLRG